MPFIPRPPWLRRHLNVATIMVVALAFAAAIAVVTLPKQGRAPGLRVLKVLGAPHQEFPLLGIVAGTSGLAWSSDGQRLAAFVNGGAQIMVTSIDGKVVHVSPRYHGPRLGWKGVLAFFSENRRLLTDPAIPEQDNSLADDAQNIGMSVLDVDTGNVVRHVPGAAPGRGWHYNIAQQLAVSPSGTLAATVNNFDRAVGRYISIYSTKDWQVIKKLPLSDQHSLHGADALTFSRNGKMLAVTYADRLGKQNKIDIFDIATWALCRTILAFPEEAPPLRSAGVKYVGFNHDDSLIAVAGQSGGPYRRGPDGSPAPSGEGQVKFEYPKDPIRVLKVSDGTRVASAHGTEGSIWIGKSISWSPTKNMLAFIDTGLVLNFWEPASGDGPKPIREVERATTAIAFSPDGNLLGQAYGEGIRLFDLSEPGDQSHRHPDVQRDVRAQGRQRMFVAENGQKLADAERQVDDLAQCLAKAEVKTRNMTLRAPISGTIASSSVTTTGRVVMPSEELMRIVPDGSTLEIEAYLQNKDIGFVRPGQEVTVKIESFPFTRYGTVPGTVLRVATDAIPEPDAQMIEGNPSKSSKTGGFAGGAQRTQNLVFPIAIRPEAASIRGDTAEVPLSPGMAVAVEMKTGRRRILEYLFAPLVEVGSQAMRER